MLVERVGAVGTSLFSWVTEIVLISPGATFLVKRGSIRISFLRNLKS